MGCPCKAQAKHCCSRRSSGQCTAQQVSSCSVVHGAILQQSSCWQAAANCVLMSMPLQHSGTVCGAQHPEDSKDDQSTLDSHDKHTQFFPAACIACLLSWRLFNGQQWTLFNGQQWQRQCLAACPVTIVFQIDHMGKEWNRSHFYLFITAYALE